MLSDFRMIQHRFEDEIDIIPVADVHLGAMESSEKEWASFCRRVEETPNTYLILAGDMVNNSTRSTRFANPFDERHRPREAKRLLTQYLEPIADRILCLIPGNHERRTTTESDQDLIFDVACKLNIEHLFRENIAFMSIGLGTRPNGNAETLYTFAVTHGAGGGMTGAGVNRNEKFGSIIDVDCLVTAHIHKGFITMPQKLVLDNKNGSVIPKHYVVISCPSWLNYGGYAARQMLPPALTCQPQVLHLTKTSHGRGKRIITTW